MSDSEFDTCFDTESGRTAVMRRDVGDDGWHVRFWLPSAGEAHEVAAALNLKERGY